MTDPLLDIPDTADPPPPFPFHSPSNARQPPRFEGERSQLQPIPSSPPPSFEVAIAQGSSPRPPTPPAPAPETPPEQDSGEPRESGERPRLRRQGSSGSNPSFNTAPNSPYSSSTDSSSEEEAEEVRLDRQMWQADIDAGYSLEERVRREEQRRAARALGLPLDQVQTPVPQPSAPSQQDRTESSQSREERTAERQASSSPRPTSTRQRTTESGVAEVRRTQIGQEERRSDSAATPSRTRARHASETDATPRAEPRPRRSRSPDLTPTRQPRRSRTPEHEAMEVIGRSSQESTRDSDWRDARSDVGSVRSAQSTMDLRAVAAQHAAAENARQSGRTEAQARQASEAQTSRANDARRQQPVPAARSPQRTTQSARPKQKSRDDRPRQTSQSAFDLVGVDTSPIGLDSAITPHSDRMRTESPTPGPSRRPPSDSLIPSPSRQKQGAESSTSERTSRDKAKRDDREQEQTDQRERRESANKASTTEAAIFDALGETRKVHSMPKTAKVLGTKGEHTLFALDSEPNVVYQLVQATTSANGAGLPHSKTSKSREAAEDEDDDIGDMPIWGRRADRANKTLSTQAVKNEPISRSFEGKSTSTLPPLSSPPPVPPRPPADWVDPFSAFAAADVARPDQSPSSAHPSAVQSPPRWQSPLPLDRAAPPPPTESPQPASQIPRPSQPASQPATQIPALAQPTSQASTSSQTAGATAGGTPQQPTSQPSSRGTTPQHSSASTPKVRSRTSPSPGQRKGRSRKVPAPTHAHATYKHRPKPRSSASSSSLPTITSRFPLSPPLKHADSEFLRDPEKWYDEDPEIESRRTLTSVTAPPPLFADEEPEPRSPSPIKTQLEDVHAPGPLFDETTERRPSLGSRRGSDLEPPAPLFADSWSFLSRGSRSDPALHKEEPSRSYVSNVSNLSGRSGSRRTESPEPIQPVQPDRVDSPGIIRLGLDKLHEHDDEEPVRPDERPSRSYARTHRYSSGDTGLSASAGRSALGADAAGQRSASFTDTTEASRLAAPRADTKTKSMSPNREAAMRRRELLRPSPRKNELQLETGEERGRSRAGKEAAKDTTATKDASVDKTASLDKDTTAKDDAADKTPTATEAPAIAVPDTTEKTDESEPSHTAAEFDKTAASRAETATAAQDTSSVSAADTADRVKEVEQPTVARDLDEPAQRPSEGKDHVAAREQPPQQQAATSGPTAADPVASKQPEAPSIREQEKPPTPPAKDRPVPPPIVVAPGGQEKPKGGDSPVESEIRHLLEENSALLNFLEGPRHYPQSQPVKQLQAESKPQLDTLRQPSENKTEGTWQPKPQPQSVFNVRSSTPTLSKPAAPPTPLKPQFGGYRSSPPRPQVGTYTHPPASGYMGKPLVPDRAYSEERDTPPPVPAKDGPRPQPARQDSRTSDLIQLTPPMTPTGLPPSGQMSGLQAGVRPPVAERIRASVDRARAAIAETRSGTEATRRPPEPPMPRYGLDRTQSSETASLRSAGGSSFRSTGPQLDRARSPESVKTSLQKTHSFETPSLRSEEPAKPPLRETPSFEASSIRTEEPFKSFPDTRRLPESLNASPETTRTTSAASLRSPPQSSKTSLDTTRTTSAASMRSPVTSLRSIGSRSSLRPDDRVRTPSTPIEKIDLMPFPSPPTGGAYGGRRPSASEQAATERLRATERLFTDSAAKGKAPEAPERRPSGSALGMSAPATELRSGFVPLRPPRPTRPAPPIPKPSTSLSREPSISRTQPGPDAAKLGESTTAEIRPISTTPPKPATPASPTKSATPASPSTPTPRSRVPPPIPPKRKSLDAKRLSQLSAASASESEASPPPPRRPPPPPPQPRRPPPLPPRNNRLSLGSSEEEPSLAELARAAGLAEDSLSPEAQARAVAQAQAEAQSLALAQALSRGDVIDTPPRPSPPSRNTSHSFSDTTTATSPRNSPSSGFASLARTRSGKPRGPRGPRAAPPPIPQRPWRQPGPSGEHSRNVSIETTATTGVEDTHSRSASSVTAMFDPLAQPSTSQVSASQQQTRPAEATHSRNTSSSTAPSAEHSRTASFTDRADLRRNVLRGSTDGLYVRPESGGSVSRSTSAAAVEGHEAPTPPPGPAHAASTSALPTTQSNSTVELPLTSASTSNLPARAERSEGDRTERPEDQRYSDLTDVDIYVARLQGSGREFEGLTHVENFLGPAIDPGASREAMDTLVESTVNVDSRRVNAAGKVKLKMSVLGARVSSCPVCMSQFRGGDAVLCLPNCGHVGHSSCVREWMKRSSVCMVCRARVGDD